MKPILKHPSKTFEELVLLISPSVFLDFRFVRLGFSLGFSRSLSLTTLCKLFTHTLPLKRILSDPRDFQGQRRGMLLLLNTCQLSHVFICELISHLAFSWWRKPVATCRKSNEDWIEGSALFQNYMKVHIGFDISINNEISMCWWCVWRCFRQQLQRNVQCLH